MRVQGMLRAALAAAAGFAMAAAQAATYRVEAENATRTSDLVVASDVAGYSGSGFVTPFSAAGAKVTATFGNVAAGTYQVRMHYHAYGAQQNFVSIDGGAAQDLPWPQTHGVGTGWGDVVISNVQLAAGTHTVAVSKGWGYIDLDYVELVSSGTQSLVGEAENGTVSGSGVSKKYDDPNASGGGYVGNFTSNGDTLTVRIPGVTAGNWDVAIRYRAWTNQQNNVQVNGGAVQSKAFPAAQNNAWTDLVMPGVALVGGTNTFTISKDWGYMDVDSVKISSGGSSGSGSSSIVLRQPLHDPTDYLQVGNANYAYWIDDGVWGAGNLTRGTYTGLNGTQYESSYGRSLTVGPNGEVAWRSAWKWPTGTTEVKSYPSAVFGAKPGFYNTWTTPGGHQILLPNETYSQTYPSGATPGTFLPMQANGALPAINSSLIYNHQVTPSGRGHLSYDIWLQDSQQQINGFSAPPITHEIMIPVDYWGNYGAYGYRNPGWYSHDVTLDGRLWHVYFVRNFPSGQAGSGWTFVVFEPDAPLGAGALKTLNLSTFLNYLTTRTDSAGQKWASGTEWLVSVELGVEPVEGVGDIEISNYRVWKP